VVREMANHKRFEYKFVGARAHSSLQWARYETLVAKSSESELIHLCDNESPVVRSYAFQGLIEKKSSKILELLINHIHDTGEFERIMGCLADPCYVSDFYLEQVGYFPDDSSSYKITPLQREILDSLMLFGSEITLRMPGYDQIRLYTRKYMLEHFAPKEGYYKRIREIVSAGVIEALPALAKFKNQNDISVIKNVYDTKGLIGEGYVFDAIINFPHAYLFDIVEKEVKNDLYQDNYFDGSNYRFYKALIKYKTQRSKELLALTISKNDGENQIRRANKIKDLISNNPNKMFTELLK